MKTQFNTNLKSYLIKNILICLAYIVTSSTSVFAFQDNDYTLYRGEILDKNSKKALVFATIAVATSNISTISNTEGEFSLKIPNHITQPSIIISFLGYKTETILLEKQGNKMPKYLLSAVITQLKEVKLSAPKSAESLVKEVFARRGDNYINTPTTMTAFYRETIKKRRKNVSLSEAVVTIYKTPYTSKRKDAVQLYKARKSTDYSKMDTVALKLQGGPYNTLYTDIVKYPEYIFSEDYISEYTFSFDGSTRVNDKLVYIINFIQKPNTTEQLYKGKLYIEADKKILTRAIYSLNITNKEKASRLFVRKKPRNVKVWPNQIAYRVDYREKNGKWYYSYSNVLLEFKIDWDKKLFNSVYSMTCEMAITNWKKDSTSDFPKPKERIKTSIILADEASGFSDPDFWGAFNIIEPEKSIESAIKKIKRQLKRAKP